MDNDQLQELLMEINRAVTTLALRITVLEGILLEKGIVDQDELIKKTEQATEAFSKMLKESLAQHSNQSD